ncbi:MAG: hypothetical protein IPM45_18155 [Acidimicrobiales bacterium]|nr:hypothetical protein [Acidimicrobiales bacterium]
MILEDFVMLGKTVPEPKSDGRVFVCSAGYSDELRGLVRIYPLGRHAAPRRWSVNTVRLERNPEDHRAESWKIAGDRTAGAHERINEGFESVGQLAERERPLRLKRTVVSSIAEANARRLSLAIIEPTEVELFFEHNPDSPDSPQLRLFEAGASVVSGAKRFPFIPRLHFHDEDGEHQLMLRDWGCFEFMRKNGDDRRFGLVEALHLDGTVSLLVGNLNNQRTAWLVISVLRGLRTADQPPLPLEIGATA